MTASDYGRIRYAIDVLQGAGRRLPEAEQQTIAVACCAIARVFQGVGLAEEPRPEGPECPAPDAVTSPHR